MTSDRGSGIIQSERGSGHIHSSERDSGIGGITIGPISRNRGSNGHTGDMIIGKHHCKHRNKKFFDIFSFQVINHLLMLTLFCDNSKPDKPRMARSVDLQSKTENLAQQEVMAVPNHNSSHPAGNLQMQRK